MNRLLLDTHAFLWLASGDARLSQRFRNRYKQAVDTWLLSAASIWEMAIKQSLGKLVLKQPLAELVRTARVRQGIEVLPIGADHAIAVAGLPFHHRDPFDRLLASQALTESVVIASADEVFEKYGVERFW